MSDVADAPRRAPRAKAVLWLAIGALIVAVVVVWAQKPWLTEEPQLTLDTLTEGFVVESVFVGALPIEDVLLEGEYPIVYEQPGGGRLVLESDGTGMVTQFRSQSLCEDYQPYTVSGPIHWGYAPAYGYFVTSYNGHFYFTTSQRTTEGAWPDKLMYPRGCDERADSRTLVLVDAS